MRLNVVVGDFGAVIAVSDELLPHLYWFDNLELFLYHRIVLESLNALKSAVGDVF